MNEFYAYIDDFNTITVLVPLRYRKGHIERLTLCRHDDEEVSLKITHKGRVGDEMKYVTTFSGYVLLNEPYTVVDDTEQSVPLHTGKIVRTALFDDIYAYDGHDLGLTYTKEATTFKVWTPVAKKIQLVLIDLKERHHKHALTYQTNGVWSVTVEGDMEGYRYYYEGFVNGKSTIFTDPYGVSSTANGKENYVIDLAKTYQFKHQAPEFSGNLSDAIIYEASIRDLTYLLSEGEHQSTYLGFVKEGLKTPKGNPAGLDYLKTLGVTHIQLLPMYDFEGVDELDRFKQYNWGYNPSQYNVPEGSFTLNPNDPYARINEAKEMIDKLHAAGFCVVMDVVYNHVYETRTFPFEQMVPGYAFRVDKQGIMTDSSGCGNDIASERKMMRKFIIDSALYWLNEYNLDGFRFDLMGLLDVTTINKLRQKIELKKPHAVMYGEGWNIPSTLPDIHRAHMDNKHVLFTVGHFNDRFREAIKGATFNIKDIGYIAGGFKDQALIKHLLQGSTPNHQFRYPYESINYVECHDNHTLFDKLMLALPNTDETTRQKMQQLATSMVLLAQGVPFIHAGQECFRTKQGVENSYQHPDEINAFDWTLVDAHQDAIDDVKALIKLRKEEPLFRLKSRSTILKRTFVQFSPHGCASYELKKGGRHYVVLFKCSKQDETLTLDKPFDVVFDSTKQNHGTTETVTLEGIGTIVLKSEEKEETHD